MRLKIAIAQVSPRVGDLKGNADKVLELRSQVMHADVIVFPELFQVGYPPDDLLHKPCFMADLEAQMARLAEATADDGPDIITGAPNWDNGKMYNSAFHMAGGAVRAVRSKVEIPNYNVFSEKRYFASGRTDTHVNFDPIKVRGVEISCPVCEDLWFPSVIRHQKNSGAELVIAINASPYCTGRLKDRYDVVRQRVEDVRLPVIYCNTIHGIDELVFDGASFAIFPERSEPYMQMPQFEDALRVFEVYREDDTSWSMVSADGGSMVTPIPDEMEADWRACVMGLRDYVIGTGFFEKGVVLGMSGGIDSAVVAAMAVDALGADKVNCIMLPYRYTSDESIRDAKECADKLGVQYEVVPIEQAVAGVMGAVEHWLDPANPGITEENIQSRVRAVILLARSNKAGTLLLNTGNNDEKAAGFSTYGGDAAGGFGCLAELPKVRVFALAEWRNKNRPKGLLGPEGEVIPPNIITKPPTAELAEGQKDSDTLPEYAELGRIVECLVDEDMSVSETVAATGFDRKVVADIENRIYVNEFKRRQSPPGVRIKKKNFGRGRRYPISHAYRSA